MNSNISGRSKSIHDITRLHTLVQPSSIKKKTTHRVGSYPQLSLRLVDFVCEEGRFRLYDDNLAVLSFHLDEIFIRSQLQQLEWPTHSKDLVGAVNVAELVETLWIVGDDESNQFG